MALLINFKDAVNANALDPKALDAVYYMDGAFQNEAAVHARCPLAALYAITVRGATGKGVFALDSENGDIDTGARGNFPQTEAWVAAQMRLNVSPIVVYANQDRWLNLGLLRMLARYGNRIERWDADYDGVAAVPSWASAKQYMDGTADRNVALADFFTGKAFDPPHYDWFTIGSFPSRWGPLNEQLVVEQYDGARKHPLLMAVYLKGVLEPKLAFLADRVAFEAITQFPNADGTPSWGTDNRGWRYQALLGRSRGQRYV
jgi:hypothetical protein